MRISQTFSQEDNPTSRSKHGHATAMYIPKENIITGRGMATVYLVPASEGSAKPTPISNKIDVPFIMKED